MIYQQEMQIVADAVTKSSGLPVTVQMMRSKTRKHEVVVARHIFMYLMRRRKERFSWREVAGFLGKDHATACHAYKVVTNMLESKDHIYTGAIQCADWFNDSMDMSVQAVVVARTIEDVPSLRDKMQSVVDAEKQKVSRTINRIFDVLQECKVQGWILHKLRSEIDGLTHH